MAADELVDKHYYQVARAGTLAERLVIAARDRIYADFLRHARPLPGSTILDVGVSDVLTDAANMLERKYPHPDHVTAVGLGAAQDFRAAFPAVTYRQIEPGAPLPFPDRAFDVVTSNAVLEHVGSDQAQQQFVHELARVAHVAFITVPNRFFPVEHHTGIPFLHWTDAGFGLSCRALGKQEWTDPATLILMSRARLARLAAPLRSTRTIRLGTTGISLGPLSSNLFLTIGSPAT